MKATLKGTLETEKSRISGENALLQYIDCEYVVKAEAIYEFDERMYVFLDYMDGRELTNVISACHTTYSEEFIKYSIWSAAKGLFAMHDKNILHRDIKSDNILCRANGDIKIADLGLSVFLTEQQAYRKTRGGTNNWLSPEIVNGTIYSKEIDVWAFGAFIHELGKGEPPFNNYHNDQSLFDAIAEKPLPNVDERCEEYNDLL